MTSATYTRNRVPYGKKATCPCCLKSHSVTQNAGTMVRHGWKETGRQVGSYGNGYQWGECKGWGMRPLEETDADAAAAASGRMLERGERGGLSAGQRRRRAKERVRAEVWCRKAAPKSPASTSPIQAVLS